MASPVFLLTISLLVSTISLPSSSTLLLPLTNSLSKTQFNTTRHLLKSISARSAARHHRRRSHISLPLSPGSDYTLSLSIGSQTLSLYMDTGSDLVWLPCHPFTCILCDGKYNPSSPLNLSSTSSTPVPCKSSACSAAHSSLSPSDLCAVARCPLDSIETSDCGSYNCPQFYYAYADGSLIARLYTDNLTIPHSSPSLIIQNFTFGCAHSALGEPVGVAGFGRGVLSLPAQLAARAPVSPQLGNRFSYCLVSHSFDSARVTHPSPLILGRYEAADKGERVGPAYDKNFVYTSILDNPKYPYFYSVGLEAVSVGGRRIPAPESLSKVDKSGNGGMVVDSGTTFTILPPELYDRLVAEFDRQFRQVNRRAGRVERSTGLSPCYYLDDMARVPAMVLHFVGNSSVGLPTRNYLYEFFDGGDDGNRKMPVGCVMMMSGGDDEDEGGGSGPVGTLGNYQQQGFEVVYDLEKGRVGFARRKCESLWDSLNQD